MSDARLSATEVEAFLFGRTLDCFDPDTGALSAAIVYLQDGTCHAVMEDGRTDKGRYGFERDLYWTQYSWFRDGGLFHFFLERVDETMCQAYFEDGSKAFLQKIKA